jgi:putative FmdB family regulatory protein
MPFGSQGKEREDRGDREHAPVAPVTEVERRMKRSGPANLGGYTAAVMPTYEYACRACGHTFEVVQSMSDDALTTCPRCAGELRKVFAPPAIAFKGSGFYATDHGKKKAKPSEKTSETSGAEKDSGGKGSKDKGGASGSGSSDSGGSGSGSRSGGSGSGGSDSGSPSGSTTSAEKESS